MPLRAVRGVYGEKLLSAIKKDDLESLLYALRAVNTCEADSFLIYNHFSLP